MSQLNCIRYKKYQTKCDLISVIWAISAVNFTQRVYFSRWIRSCSIRFQYVYVLYIHRQDNQKVPHTCSLNSEKYIYWSIIPNWNTWKVFVIKINSSWLDILLLSRSHHQWSANTYTPHGLYLELHFPSCSLITPSPVFNNMDTI